MSAISHICGADLSLDAAGGLATVSGADDTRQRLLRRLCTNEGAYIWQLDYGAGLPARIGDAMNVSDIQSIVLSQVQLEVGVDQTKPVTVSVTALSVSQYLCAISYTDAATQTTQLLELTN